MMRYLFSLVIVILLWVPLGAVAQSDYSPEVEEQARRVGKQLRCVVCQNESIEESDAQLAADMRLIVREQLSAGDSEEDVIASMRERYGDYVLLKPPVQGNTIILWLGPAALVLIFMGWWIISLRRRGEASAPVPLSEDDRDRLERLRKDRS
jgi:cytochrome c-type biogenesis protein CcmH